MKRAVAPLRCSAAPRALALAAIMAGCGPIRACSTPGRNGVVEYSTRYYGPLGGSMPLATRLALGGSMRVGAMSSVNSYGSTGSSNPAIATVAPARRLEQCCVTERDGRNDCLQMSAIDCANRPGGQYSIWEEFDLIAVGPGAVDLVTRRPDGTVIDSIGVRVDPVASLSIEQFSPADGGTFVALPSGTEVLLPVWQWWQGRVQLLDDAGTALHTDHEVVVTLREPAVAQVVPRSFGDTPPVRLGAGGMFCVTAEGRGVTTMVVVFRDLQRTITVRVP